MRRVRKPAAAGLAVWVIAAAATGADWSAKKVKVIRGFDTPESVCVDRESGFAYVSNIVTSTRGFWRADGEARISRLALDGTVDQLRWRESGPAFRFDAPKGLCVRAGVLYAADITCVRAFPLRGGAPRTIRVPGARKLNDMATDGRDVYVSDTAAGRVIRLDLSPAGRHQVIPGPAGANGLAFVGGKGYCVSWAKHDIYELDMSGRRAPRAFGLAGHFTNLDGVEPLPDGSLLVSDFVGGKLAVVSPDRRTVKVIARVKCPADIGLDRETLRVFVPQFHENQIVVYQLMRR